MTKNDHKSQQNVKRQKVVQNENDKHLFQRLWEQNESKMEIMDKYLSQISISELITEHQRMRHEVNESLNAQNRK